MGLPLWAAYALIMVWVVKDLLLYPLVRIANQSDMRPGAVRLIGATGMAKDQFNPSGYVQVRGEVWRAEAEPSAKPIAPQSPIEVRGARGLTLIVTRRSG
jgi:membrane-bound serine protease (ClpP class)